MDGKQARRTDQSSSLGMLFDHGFDSINTYIQCLTVSRCVGVSDVQLVFAVFIGVFAFFTSTFET